MEVYKEVEGNAFNPCNAYDAPSAITTITEKDLNQPAQTTGPTGMEVDGNKFVSPRALKATSGKTEKRLRTRQKTRSKINSGKTAGAAIRQRAI